MMIEGSNLKLPSFRRQLAQTMGWQAPRSFAAAADSRTWLSRFPGQEAESSKAASSGQQGSGRSGTERLPDFTESPASR
jgi:hypothetical protein